ncbi:MAG: AAA family ATPase [Candidatus Riflebacteria bacterium]|nr:AAA family ATPase [Candidatus Riflebacteria bacterium]
MAVAAEGTPAPAPAPAPDRGLDSGTYEIIRGRLTAQGKELQARLDTLNANRKATFGTIEFALTGTERITTGNNCVPRDMVAIGDRFLFGYNVFLGLRTETKVSDVFAVYGMKDGTFLEQSLEILTSPRFEADFKDLYKYYKNTIFLKFVLAGPHLYALFQIGRTAEDVKAFKWLIREGKLDYQDNRSEHEVRLPPQHEFEWKRTVREMHRLGVHPHVSIEDRIFVETVGGDLTIKVEDNTESGEGIYAEPVQDPDQTLDDAEILYAVLGNLILLKIKPYQEKDFRYIVYSEKVRQAVRLDSIANACVLLPNDQGIIFPNGYYLQTGDHKEFEAGLRDMRFERRIVAPNGEDYLFVFHNRAAGAYILLSYNVIGQRVDTPLICGGWSLFEDGRMINFQEAREPQKHHAIQVWQSPYVGPNFVAREADQSSFLYKIGNRDIVRAMAEVREIVTLCGKEDTFANLYLDLAKSAGDILDAFFWLDRPEAGNLREVLLQVRGTATAAVEEFEKVARIRKNTLEQTKRVAARAAQAITAVQTGFFEDIDAFVQAIADLRGLRGEIIALRDLRYVDLALVDKLEKEVDEQSVFISGRCAEFLLSPEALTPYRRRVAEHREAVAGLAGVAAAKKAEAAAAGAANDLQMLIEVVSNLKIDDAMQRTQIIDSISGVFADLNQVRAGIQKRIQELAVVEGQAEFTSQMKLLQQSLINAIEACDTPERCDEQMTRLMVQIEELEGRFADFDQFVVTLSERRQEAYAAFESRKLALTEARSKRASGLMTAADRILKGVEARLARFKTVQEIHGYFAADLMIDKVRTIVKQLGELKDTVKADELTTRLRTLLEDGIRQLKDRQDLFADGDNVIRFGPHKFSVNRQPLDLTFVQREGAMFFHLTGTGFYEKVDHPEFNGFRDLWTQELVSETPALYRAEYLAHVLLQDLEAGRGGTLAEAAAWDEAALLRFVQTAMGPRYTEGYSKGVHDQDAARLLRALVEMTTTFGLLRYSPPARALATFFWTQMGKGSFVWDPTGEASTRLMLEAKMVGAGAVTRVFPGAGLPAEFLRELQAALTEFVRRHSLFSIELVDESARFLFETLAANQKFPISREAAEIYVAFQTHLKQQTAGETFTQALGKVRRDPAAVFALGRAWVDAFLVEQPNEDGALYRDEVALLLGEESIDKGRLYAQPARRMIEGLAGNHPLVVDGKCQLHYNRFIEKVGRYRRDVVPRFTALQGLKRSLLDTRRDELRLDEFKAKVLTSFVRNRLIDEVYLPLIGANLAKQIGEVGENTRPDRMGLLLLISPPGYGKTTLMEYVANRLGIVFIKVNGPAIGSRVTSIDPVEAPNAAARQELERLNLAFAMGENVMIYVDDIQHCSGEFLEKFISLCDAQRKIEGVFGGRTRTYDLRGRKVAVVMAGNPYTESGERFNIPDMLANRADTYNLGDIIGGHADAFVQSYLENAATSNPVLSKLASRSMKDYLGVLKLAQTGSRDGVEFEGSWSAEETGEFVGTMKKLLRVRDVVLAINREYIKSAAQGEAYRTEPAFKLQGSYRNMNKMAEKILPIMNDEEVETVITTHYQNEAQTLATGAEFNLLKFRELQGKLTDADRRRIAEIRKTFQRNLLLHGADTGDRVGQLMAQLTTLSAGVDSIKDVLYEGLGLGTYMGGAAPAAELKAKKKEKS